MNLSPIEICFRTLDLSGTPQHIAALVILEGQADINLWKEKIKLIAPSFSRLGILFSTESESKANKSTGFKPEENIREAATDPSTTLQDLIVLNTNRILENFGNMPPWEILIGFSAVDNKSTVLFRLHHALGDGISGLAFFHKLLLIEKSGHRLSELKSKSNQLETPFIPAALTLLDEAFQKKGLRDIPKINSDSRHLLLYSLDNSLFKIQKRKFNCTLTPVLLSIVAKSAIAYFKEEGILPSYIRALIPVTLKGRSRPSDLENEIGGAAIRIPLSELEKDELIPLLRDNLITRVTEKAYGAYYLCAKIFSVLPLFLRKISCRLAANKIDMICTFLQMPGTAVKDTISGRELAIGEQKILAEFAIPALMPSQGIGFGIVKQGKETHLAAILDPAIIRDIERMDQAILRTLENEKSQHSAWHRPCL